MCSLSSETHGKDMLCLFLTHSRLWQMDARTEPGSGSAGDFYKRKIFLSTIAAGVHTWYEVVAVKSST